MGYGARKYFLNLNMTRGQWEGLLHLAKLGYHVRLSSLDPSWEPAQVRLSGLSAINALAEAINVEFRQRTTGSGTPTPRP